MIGRFLDAAVDFLEEVVLPFRLLSRWAKGKLPLWLAWDIFWTTWAPFKFCRRTWGRLLVMKDRAYRGHDESHHSLSMNLEAMLTMTECELKEYRADLNRRRSKQHEGDIVRRGSHDSHH